MPKKNRKKLLKKRKAETLKKSEMGKDKKKYERRNVKEKK